MALLLRALRWRAAASVATALLAAVTVLGAVVGPLWTRAGSESLLRDALATAEPFENAALGEDHTTPGTSSLQALDAAMAGIDLPYHRPAVRGMKLLGTAKVPQRDKRIVGSLLWRDGFCEHVRVLTGRCPTRAGEVLLHPYGARTLKIAGVGATLDGKVTQLFRTEPSLPTTYTVVGTYVPLDPTGPYWTGEETAFQSSVAVSEEGPDRAPALLTVPETFDDIAAGAAAGEQPLGFVTSTRVLDIGAIGLAQEDRLRTSVLRAQQQVALATTSADTLELRDDVVGQLDDADREGRALGTASTVVLAQLVLLAVAVLVLVVGSSAEARAPEVAAARLRGLRTRTVVQLAVGEPLAMVAVGAPLGALGAWVLVKALAAASLVDGTSVGVPGSTLLALLGALLVLVVTVVATCARELGRPVLELWQRTAKPPSRTAVARDAVLVAAGAVLTVLCARGGDPWVLLTPVPLAVAVALLGGRVLPLLARPSLRRSRGRRRLPTFLAVRQLVRRREGAWLAGLLVVAAGLAGTAVAARSVEDRAAEVRAGLEVGAVQVLRVQEDPDHPDLDLRAAVRAVDPSGTRAMAVREYLPYGDEPGGRLLAVDTDRLAAVTHWDEGVTGLPLSRVLDAVRRPVGRFPTAVVTKAVAADPRAALAPNLPSGGVEVVDVEGRRHPVLVGATADALPRGLGKGTLVDWNAFGPVFNDRLAALQEVWTTTTDPALRKALEDKGIEVVDVEDEADQRALLGRQGPGLAVLLSLAAAVLALVLAAAVTLFSVLMSARRRGWELAALASVGVPPKDLLRATRRETLLLLLSGLGLGAGAAWLACRLVLPELPLFTDGGIGLAVPRTPATLPLVVLGAAALVLAVVTAVLVGRVLLRAADPARLREVQA